MNKKEELKQHVIAVTAFVVFIALGLACATSQPTVSYDSTATSEEEAIKKGDAFASSAYSIYQNSGYASDKAKTDAQKAAIEYTKAIELAPGNAETYYKRAKINTKICNWLLSSDSIAYNVFLDYDRCIQLSSDNNLIYKAYIEKAQYYERYEPDRSQKSMFSADYIREASFPIGTALDGRKQRVETRKLAIMNYEGAISADPSQAYPYGRIAYIYEELTDVDMALSYYSKALEIEPDNTLYKDAVGRLDRTKGLCVLIILGGLSVGGLNSAGGLSGYFDSNEEQYENLIASGTRQLNVVGTFYAFNDNRQYVSSSATLNATLQPGHVYILAPGGIAFREKLPNKVPVYRSDRIYNGGLAPDFYEIIDDGLVQLEGDPPRRTRGNTIGEAGLVTNYDGKAIQINYFPEGILLYIDGYLCAWQLSAKAVLNSKKPCIQLDFPFTSGTKKIEVYYKLGIPEQKFKLFMDGEFVAGDKF